MGRSWPIGFFKSLNIMARRIRDHRLPERERAMRQWQGSCPGSSSRHGCPESRCSPRWASCCSRMVVCRTRRWWGLFVALAAVALVPSPVPAVASWPYRGLPLKQAIALNAPLPNDPTLELAFTLQNVGQLVLLAAMIGSVGGMAVRFRRSEGVDHQQLKWFTYGALLTVVVLVIWSAGFLSDPIGGAISALLLDAILQLPTMPPRTLRSRLYDIDRLLSRAILYDGTSGILEYVFVALAHIAGPPDAAVLPVVGRAKGSPVIEGSS